MAQNKLRKPNKIIIASILLILLIFIVGFTFAYFVADITGNDTAEQLEIDAGILEINFQTSEYINTQSGELIKDTEKDTKADKNEFTISHTAKSNLSAQYTLELTDIAISDNLKSADFKWELVINSKVIKTGNFASIGSNTKITLTDTPQTLAQGQTANGILRVWLSETTSDQSSLYEGTFSGKISLSAKSLAE